MEDDPDFKSSWTNHSRFGNLFDFDLLSSSPCLDAGPVVTGMDAIDYDEDDRYGGDGYWDIGSQEKQ